MAMQCVEFKLKMTYSGNTEELEHKLLQGSQGLLCLRCSTQSWTE